MKKLLAASCICLALACGSGQQDGTETDSTTIIDPNATRNDIPMRTTDTSENLMKDSMNAGDTMRPQ